jgi:hypothetical protein
MVVCVSRSSSDSGKIRARPKWFGRSQVKANRLIAFSFSGEKPAFVVFTSPLRPDRVSRAQESRLAH